MSLLCGFCVFLYLIGNLKGQFFLHVIIKISLNLHTKALSINTCFFYSYYIQYCTVRVFITFSLVFFSYFCSVLTTHSTQYYTVHMSTVHSTHVYSICLLPRLLTVPDCLLYGLSIHMFAFLLSVCPSMCKIFYTPLSTCLLA